MSVVGTTLMSSSSTFSPWFKRGALNALFSAEVISVGGSGSLSISVEHRNNDETTASPAGSFPAMSGTGVDNVDLSGLKENVRFAYTVAGGLPSDWVHFRVLNPAWYD